VAGLGNRSRTNLGENLAKDDDGDGRNEEAGQPRGQVRQDDGEQAVHRNVACGSEEGAYLRLTDFCITQL